ncbi:hypothetical protein BC936DRAFT_138991 [Jimgerdemannia flammicorona]|uniref:Uncharacterized protein n=1 Tax=Jimgerdemannia flammicorona TaxID=994334 RepID=A0A433DI29_9FUNG|nr:hypothetical protein BC936DRAFT_138991 [Jimgerdemannia flammicorona]
MNDHTIDDPLSQEPWYTYTAQDLEILSDVVDLATQTARSKASEATSFISIFRAYDAVLRARRIDPSTDTMYYRFLLRLSSIEGRTWKEKFERGIKDLGTKTPHPTIIFDSFEHSSVSTTRPSVSRQLNSNTIAPNIPGSQSTTAPSASAPLSILRTPRKRTTERVGFSFGVDNFQEPTFQSSPKKRSNSTLDDNAAPDLRLIMGPAGSEDLLNAERTIDIGHVSVVNSERGSSNTQRDHGQYVFQTPNVGNGHVARERLPYTSSSSSEDVRIYFRAWRLYTRQTRELRTHLIKQWLVAVRMHESNLIRDAICKWCEKHFRTQVRSGYCLINGCSTQKDDKQYLSFHEISTSVLFVYRRTTTY